MKNFSKLVKQILILGIILANIATVTFAAWWGTPGYEWCFSKGITTIMTQKEMTKKVSQADFYAIVLKYLRYKGVEPGRNVMQTVGDVSSMNSTLLGMMNTIDKYVIKDSLTALEYRQVMTYMEHAEEIVEKQQNLISRDDIKAFKLYMSLARYKAAKLIDNTVYRTQEVAKNSNVKFAEILDYGIKPYYGNITRKEFLILMFSLLSDQKIPEEDSLQEYNESGVLIGYNSDLMLQKEITYSEIFTFLYTFEAFDFNPSERNETEE